MTFTNEMYTLLIRYTKDIDGTDITYEELRNLPHWRCVWGWWKAKSYYQMDGYYTRLEDVPEGLENFTIMDKVMTQYHCIKGVKTQQSMSKEDCKSIYGK